ncbi:MAG: DPP IV N-terminal domain-containing protein [candidate division WOR-3 bacterium]|nr:DPP IV N-terminal domain-containing protein [candidate division WOR-3 bacterium]
MKPYITSGEREPAVSPDGEFIAYTNEGKDEIWLFEVATEESAYLTDGSLPDWSPDGEWIVYVKNRNIHKINVATKDVTQLTTWGSCFFPAWSPSGNRIAFDTDYDDPEGAKVIWLMDTNGTNLKDISVHGTGEWRQPKWSPSGVQIVHIRYVNVTYPEIFVMDSSGQNGVRLTDNLILDESPVWSPAGSRIAYVSASEYVDYNIWTMDTTGANTAQLTSTGGCDPTWTPDGNCIVYAMEEITEKATYIEVVYHLWIMNTDGTEKRQLTFGNSGGRSGK